MKILFDTNVLVAATVARHPHHLPCLAALRQARERAITAALCTHAVAEAYAVLTAAPFSPRISPARAIQVAEQEWLPHLQAVALDAADYLAAARLCAQGGWVSGAIYDALHVRAAERAGCDRIWTLDVRHFLRLAPEWAGRITPPLA